MESKSLPRFVKYGKIASVEEARQLDRDLLRNAEVFEKIDGGNCQVRNHNYQLLAGSKANYLRGSVIRRHPWFGKFVKWMYSNESLYQLPSGVIVFGEWSGNHAIDYGGNNDKFFVLDVFDLDSERFMEYEKARALLKDLKLDGLEYLIIKAQGRVDLKTVNSILLEGSNFYDGEKEGLVIKNYSTDQQKRVKLYHPNYSEKVSLAEGGVDYLTPARFEKGVYHLQDKLKTDRVGFSALVSEVRHDVLTEEDVFLETKQIERRLSIFLQKGILRKVRGYIH